MNKSLFISISLFLLLCLNVKGQLTEKVNKFFGYEYQKGTVVLNSGDTLKGDILFNNGYENYQRLVFRDTLKQKTDYKTEDVRMFAVDTMVFYPKKLKKKLVFMCLLVNDSLKIFLHRYFMATQYYSGTENMYIYEKPDGQTLEVLTSRLFPFKKRVGEFFSDDPELSEKILNKTYKFDDLYIIAKEYNTWLRQKKSATALR
jgi:hypothetical protein